MGNTKRVLHSDWPLEPTLPAEAACFKNSWLSFPSLKQNKSFFLAFTDLDFVLVHKKTKKELDRLPKHIFLGEERQCESKVFWVSNTNQIKIVYTFLAQMTNI